MRSGLNRLVPKFPGRPSRGLRLLRFRASPATPARGFHQENVTRLHFCLVGTGELLDPPVGADHGVSAQRPRLAAFQAKVRHLAVAREDGGCHGLEETQPANSTIAAPPLPPA